MFGYPSRYLNPHNFSKEIYLEYNLGPQHMLEGLCEEVYRTRLREYIYKRDSMGRLVSEMYGNNLVDRDIGSAVRTFRKNESLKSKFPNKFWE